MGISIGDVLGVVCIGYWVVRGVAALVESRRAVEDDDPWDPDDGDPMMLVDDDECYDHDLVERAREFATAAHDYVGQVRKYTGEDYIRHPEEVVALVESVPHTAEMMAAAWLHDTVEDTNVTLDDILNEFGNDVCALVEELTDVSRPSDGNRQRRKEIDLNHTANASDDAKTVKLADLISNTRSIVAHDPDFARVYLREKAALLKVLKEGDGTLWEQADALVKEGLEKIKPTDVP